MRKVFVLLCLVLAGCAGRPKEVKAFNARLDEYLKLEPALLRHQSQGYLKPRVVVLDLRKGQIDDEVFMGLPEELRAQDPGEVKSVIWVEYRKRFAGGGKTITGQASGASSFFALEAHIVVIDVSGSQPVVSFTECYQKTLPQAYRDASGAGKFRLIKGKEGGWEVETPCTDAKSTHRLIHGTAQGKPPATGGSGENVGEPPTKEIIDRIKSLPKA